MSSPNKEIHGVSRRRLLAFLSAIGLFLAAIEYLLPKPVPFIRLGISNIPLVLMLDVLRFRELLVLAAVKVLGQGLINGTLVSYVLLFSAVGTFTALFTMAAVRRLFGLRLSLIGVSLWGALTSNLAQLGLSVLILLGENAWVIGPVILGTGGATGFLVGWLAQMFQSRSVWFREVRRALVSD